MSENSNRGARIGRETVGSINALISEMETACQGDPEALAVATGIVLRHLVHTGGTGHYVPADEALKRLRAAAIQAMRASGLTWAAIGERLGISRTRAEDLAKPSRARAARAARVSRAAQDDGLWAA